MSFYGGAPGAYAPGPAYQPQAPMYPSLPQAYPSAPAPGYPAAAPAPSFNAYPQAGYPQNVLSMPEPFGSGPSYVPAAPGSLPYPVHPTSVPSAPSYNAPMPYTSPSYPPAMPTYPAAGAYPQQTTFPPATYPSAGPAAYPPATYPPASCPPTTYPSAGYPPAHVPPAGGMYGAQPAGMTAGYGSVSYGNLPLGQGTIRPYPGFNPEHDSQMLRKAMKGLGTDEQTIINILGQRCNQQRQQLKLTYKTLFGRDLLNDLSSELSFRFKQTILALMMTPVEYDAEQLYKAIRGLGTNEETLVEILSTRSNHQIMEIRNAYRTMYRNDLERDLIGDTSGHFRRFVVSLVTAGRREDSAIDFARARSDAMALYQAGEARWGTDESVFNQILCSNNHAQLRVVFDEYQKIAHRPIHQSLSREMSGDLLMGMQTLVSVVTNPHKYFADRLYRSMRGAGTNDDTLIRVIISRSEVDLVQIKQEFQRSFGNTVESWIQGDTSGDYRKILLTLARGN